MLDYWDGICRSDLQMIYTYKHIPRPAIYIARPEMKLNNKWIKSDILKVGVTKHIDDIIRVREQSGIRFTILSEILFEDYQSAKVAEKIFHKLLDNYRSYEIDKQTEHYEFDDSLIELLIEKLKTSIATNNLIKLKNVNLYKDHNTYFVCSKIESGFLKGRIGIKKAPNYM